jgi:thiosulfate dehydrogenase [quinone] large subunit
LKSDGDWGIIKTEPNWLLQSLLMKTDLDCGGCDPRVAAVALGRWCIGVMLLFYGIGKLGAVGEFAAYLSTLFKETWLPAWGTGFFGHLLPYTETILGALLILGIARNVVLFIAGLQMVVLMFGQVLLSQPPVVFYNASHLFMIAAVLFLARFDRWVLWPRCWRAESVGEAPRDEAAGGTR